ncbi:hypothetical protein IWQ56_001759 [Coemansia nantahalensis]|nr:hypothetical protein IWQ56_001759 [Coemansia nantahalensis]
MMVDGYDLGYNAPTAAVVVLAAVNALLGAAFSAGGVYLLTLAPREFSYTAAPAGIVVLGLVTLYAAGVAAAGVVSCSLLYTRLTLATAALVMLGEIAVLASAAHDPLGTRMFHESAWRRIHRRNPLALQHFEHTYGCCGFETRLDMPSHAGCAKGAGDAAVVGGCAEPLAHAAFYASKLALRWCTAALVTQVLILVAGAWLVGQARVINTLWDVNIGVDEDGPEAPLLGPEASGDRRAEATQPPPPGGGRPGTPRPSPAGAAAGATVTKDVARAPEEASSPTGPAHELTG